MFKRLLHICLPICPTTALVLVTSLGLSACATAPSTTSLPDLKRTQTEGLLTPAQQQNAIAELARKKAEEEADALKKIQQTR